MNLLNVHYCDNVVVLTERLVVFVVHRCPGCQYVAISNKHTASPHCNIPPPDLAVLQDKYFYNSPILCKFTFSSH